MAKFETLNDETLGAVSGGTFVGIADDTPVWKRPHWQPDEYPMGSTFEAYGYLWYRIQPGDILGRIAQTYGAYSPRISQHAYDCIHRRAVAGRCRESLF